LTPVQNGVSWLYLRISFPNDEDFAKPHSIYPENTHVRILFFPVLIQSQIDGI